MNTNQDRTRSGWTFLLVVLMLICFAVSAHGLKTSIAVAGKPEQLGEGQSDPQRIIGGSTVSAQDWATKWSFVVSLNNRGSESYGGQVCGGSLIARRLVLTAAHCVGSGPLIGRGDYVVTGRDLRRPLETLRIARVVRHPMYLPDETGNFSNDIALIRLAGRGSTKRSVKTAKLVEPGAELGTFEPLSTSGWGNTDTAAPFGRWPSLLRHVDLTAIPYEDANGLNSYAGNVDPTTMVAAGLMEGGRDSCQGDSGGPLLRYSYNPDGSVMPQLVGVTSWGTGCAERGYPGVYAKVSSYIDWIGQTRARVSPRR